MPHFYSMNQVHDRRWLIFRLFRIARGDGCVLQSVILHDFGAIIIPHLKHILDVALLAMHEIDGPRFDALAQDMGSAEVDPLVKGFGLFDRRIISLGGGRQGMQHQKYNHGHQDQIIAVQ